MSLIAAVRHLGVGHELKHKMSEQVSDRSLEYAYKGFVTEKCFI